MWILGALLFISLGEIFCSNCTLPLHEVCVEGDTFKRLPSSKEDLDNGCRNVKDLAQCMLDYFGECIDVADDDKFPGQVKFIRNVLDLMDRSCDPESHVYKVISEKIECISFVLQNTSYVCYRVEYESEWDNFRTNYTKISGMKDEYGYCMYDFWESACVSVTVSTKCGDQLLDPVLEILSGLSFDLTVICHEDWAAELPKFAHALALLEKEAESIEIEI